MARQSESFFAFFALVLLLSLTLLYGCRAYDPEPPIINRAPQTYVTGAPAETTGTGFTRHMYWYGTDQDGEVVQYIYALTDSTVRILDDDQNRDEEDDRFNPAEDITTLENNDERFVGWTTKTDSIFKFTVDRGPISSKDMTFHIVAVDDRGAIDPTPARLYFLNNSLGNPRIVFRLFADVGTGPTPDWELRWSGDYLRSDTGSPERTDFPFAGFERRFRIEWEASSPNGGIIGFRYRVGQGLGEFIPASILGEKQWDLEGNSFEFGNSDPPSSELGVNCKDDASGCDPARVRFPSGNYNISVEALDFALVESEAGTGDLDFAINYAPDTQIVIDSEYPRWEVRDPGGVLLSSGSIAVGDTIPASSTAFFRSNGYDKFLSALPPGVRADSLCCDTPLNYDPSLSPGDPGYVPLVQYQSRLELVRRSPNRVSFNSNLFSAPELGDTISFWVGPLDFSYESRTVDEHRRADIDPADLAFVGGFRPRVREDLTIPGGDVPGNPGDVADTLVVHLFGSPPFPENEIPFDPPVFAQKWYLPDPGAECGGILFDVPNGEEPPTGALPQSGFRVSVRLKFVGEQDQRDPLSPVKAWTFAIFSDKDPDNEIEDGRESRDLSFFTDSPVPNEWDFRTEDTIDFWVPIQVFQASTVGDYAPDSTEPIQSSIGCLVARHLGNMTLRMHGRTTANSDSYPFYTLTTRKTTSDDATQLNMGEFGRQSPRSEVKFWFFVGGVGPVPGVPDYHWPDF